MRNITSLIILLMLVSVSSVFAQRQKMGGTEEATRQGVQATGRQAMSESDDDEGRKSTKTQTQNMDISKEPIEGVVVSLKAMTLGKDGEISRESAMNLASKGDPLLFKSGGKYYYIFNTDQEYWGEKLANYAGLSKVGIYGAKIVNNGINVIVAAKITSLE